MAMLALWDTCDREPRAARLELRQLRTKRFVITLAALAQHRHTVRAWQKVFEPAAGIALVIHIRSFRNSLVDARGALLGLAPPRSWRAGYHSRWLLSAPVRGSP